MDNRRAMTIPAAALTQDVQAGLAQIVTERIRDYTAGDSSSVREETAADILGSVCYALDVYALSQGRELTNLLGEQGARAVYDGGVAYLRDCLAQTRVLLHEAVQERLIVPVGPYNDLLDHDIPDFLDGYDIEFHAQETACCMDYPLVFDDMSVQGVLYIHQYLTTLRLEISFCRLFPQRSILRTLGAYQAQFGIDVADMPLSLFELLYDQMVYTALAGGDIKELRVTQEQFEAMERKLTCLDKGGLIAWLVRATHKAVSTLGIADPALLAYMRRYRRQLAERLATGVEHGGLRGMVLVSGTGGVGNTFTDGARMDDESFTRLIDLLTESTTAEKLRLIGENVRSMHDYVDLLEADCLFDDEYTSLFQALGGLELAVLGRAFLGGGPGIGRVTLTPEALAHYRAEAAQEWQERWLEHVGGLPQSRRDTVERLMGDLEIREAEDEIL